MKKQLLFFVLIFLSFAANAESLDTLYYDKDWKGVESSFNAEYIRIVSLPNDPKMPKSFKDYYITGELQGKGNFVRIDKYDDSKSVFDGVIESFYKSGAIHNKTNYKNGVIQGNQYEFSEDGDIKIEYAYENGIHLGYYFLYNGNLCYGKYDSKTAMPYKVIPQLSDIKQTIDDSHKYSTYILNGIKLSCSEEEVKDYGKYHRFYIRITNMTRKPIQISLNDINVNAIKKTKQQPLEVMNVEEYLKIINKKTKLAKWYHNANERINAEQAGTITIDVNSKNSYESSTTSEAYANAYSNGVRATGYGSSSSTTNGIVNTNSKINITDKAAAFEAQQIATQNINDYNAKLENKMKIREEGYLKDSSVKPYHTLGGYFNVKKSSGSELYLSIIIDNIKYPFVFKILNE